MRCFDCGKKLKHHEGYYNKKNRNTCLCAEDYDKREIEKRDKTKFWGARGV